MYSILLEKQISSWTAYQQMKRTDNIIKILIRRDWMVNVSILINLIYCGPNSCYLTTVDLVFKQEFLKIKYKHELCKTGAIL